MKNTDCDTSSDFDWADQTLQVVTEAAQFGVVAAISELERRRKSMEKLDTVTPKFTIQDIED